MEKETNINEYKKRKEKSFVTKKHNEKKDDYILYFLHYFPFAKWRAFLWNTFLLALTITSIIVLFDLVDVFLQILRSITFKMREI